MRRVSILLALSWSLPLHAAQSPARNTVGRGFANCDVGAFANPAAGRVPILAEPRNGARVLGRLPVWEDDGRAKGAYLDVMLISNGWARIANVASSTGKAPNGWIPARHLRFTMQTNVGFSEPTPKSKIVLTTGWFFGKTIQAIESCQGEWLKLKVRVDGSKPQTAWFRGACNNQETTCDGAVGDMAPE
jgi:hypothetical protein